jgi:hypothetical protein
MKPLKPKLIRLNLDNIAFDVYRFWESTFTLPMLLSQTFLTKKLICKNCSLIAWRTKVNKVTVKTARKASFLLIFTLVAAMLVTTGFIGGITKANLMFVQSPEALSVNHAYIRVNGTVDPPTLPVQQIGNTYTLTGNIENYTFTIEKNGIVFDGNGFSLSIPSYDERGNNFQVKTHPALIEIINRTDIIVKNFTIYHCDVPLSVTYSTKITLTQNTMTDCGPVYIGLSSYCSLEKNSIKHINDNMGDTIENGIATHGCHHIDIKYNQIMDCGWDGIWGDLSNSNIIGNTFIGNSEAAIQSILSYNRIIGNLFQGSSFGILADEGNNEIHHNNFINNLYSDVSLHVPNILDDGKEGNYWSSNHNSQPLVLNYSHNQSDIDHFPRTTPYIFDYQAPSVRIISPENKTYTNSTIELNFTTSELFSRASYSFDGNERVSFQNETASLTDLPVGTHQLTVYAEDEFGNEGASTVSFVVSDGSSTVTSNLLSAETSFAILLLVVVLSAFLAVILILKKLKGKKGAVATKSPV